MVLLLERDAEVLSLLLGGVHELIDDHAHGRWLRALFDADLVLVGKLDDSHGDVAQKLKRTESTRLLRKVDAVALEDLVGLILASSYVKGNVNWHLVHLWWCGGVWILILHLKR